MMFHVTLEPAEDGWIVAECPALPGCVSQGRDEKEALENIKEAITAWMWAEDQKAVQSMPPQKTPLVVAVGWQARQCLRQGSGKGIRQSWLANDGSGGQP